MYKLILTGCIAATVIFVFSYCSKDSAAVISNTSMRITVTDTLGAPVEGATVTIADAGTTKVLITGNDGRVTFNALTNNVYAPDIKKGCLSNWWGSLQMGVFLQQDVLNDFTYAIREIGFIRIVNNSSNAYIIQTPISGNPFIDANQTILLRTLSREHKLSFSLSGQPATSRDSIVDVNCGDTTTVTLPF